MTEDDEVPVRLTRQQRGQVRRAANRLLSLERQQFSSSSDPTRQYVAAIMVGGKATCTCRGWTIKRGDAPRQCSHIFLMIGRRPLRTDGEHLFVVRYMTETEGTREYNALTESRIYRSMLSSPNLQNIPRGT